MRNNKTSFSIKNIPGRWFVPRVCTRITVFTSVVALQAYTIFLFLYYVRVFVLGKLNCTVTVCRLSTLLRRAGQAHAVACLYSICCFAFLWMDFYDVV